MRCAGQTMLAYYGLLTLTPPLQAKGVRDDSCPLRRNRRMLLWAS